MYPSRPSSLGYALEGLEPRNAHCFTCRGLSYRPCAYPYLYPCPLLGLYLYHCLDHLEALPPQLGGLFHLASASESPPLPEVHGGVAVVSRTQRRRGASVGSTRLFGRRECIEPGRQAGEAHRVVQLSAKRSAELLCRPNYFGLSTLVPKLNRFSIAHPEVDLCRISAIMSGVLIGQSGLR